MNDANTYPLRWSGQWVPYRPFKRKLATALAVLTGLAFPVISPDTAEPLPNTTVSHPPEGISEITALQESTALVRDILYRKGRYLSAEWIDWLAPRIAELARQYDFDPIEILAVIQVESAFRPNAVSYAGAYGLMQMLPYVAQAQAEHENLHWQLHTREDGMYGPPAQPARYSHVSVMHPAVSLHLGISYLADLRARFPHQRDYLAAYNMGPTLLAKRMAHGWEPKGEYAGLVNKAENQLRRIARKHRARMNGWERQLAGSWESRTGPVNMAAALAPIGLR